MSCTPSKRNRSAALRLRNAISTLSIRVWPRPNDSTDEGKIDMATKRRSAMRAEKSSGNVFADLGLPHSEQELLKAKLTLQIYRLIKGRNLTQAAAGKILGIKQPHVSLLMRNRSGNFSVERLMDFLTALGQDVEISVRPARKDKDHGEVSVIA
jgi:predicted XRE-type DNA-binding protein